MLNREVSAANSVRRLTRVLAGLGVCGAMLITSGSAQAASAATGSTTCTGVILLREITSNLTVPAGATCFLGGAIIDGNVTVGQGSDFFAQRELGRLTVIKGNLSTEGADEVEVTLAVVDGNASFDGTSGNIVTDCGFVSVCLFDVSFGGNVSITNTSPAGAELGFNVVGRDLTCLGNSSITDIGGNAVQGQAFGQCAGI